MSKRLPSVTYRTFITALKDKGFKKDRTKGGHEIWEKTITQSVCIPVHGDINGGIAKRLDKEFDLGLFK